MKKILFLSKSGLSHNLLRVVLPLVPFKTDLECLDSTESLALLPARGKPFALVIIDWNVLAGAENLKAKLSNLTGHPLLKGSRFILIHAHDAASHRETLGSYGFTGYYTKPFLPEELGEIIARSLK